MKEAGLRVVGIVMNWRVNFSIKGRSDHSSPAGCCHDGVASVFLRPLIFSKKSLNSQFSSENIPISKCWQQNPILVFILDAYLFMARHYMANKLHLLATSTILQPLISTFAPH